MNNNLKTWLVNLPLTVWFWAEHSHLCLSFHKVRMRDVGGGKMTSKNFMDLSVYGSMMNPS